MNSCSTDEWQNESIAQLINCKDPVIGVSTSKDLQYQLENAIAQISNLKFQSLGRVHPSAVWFLKFI